MKKSVIDHKDFLSDDLFVYWRIHPSKKLDAFWEKFIQENAALREPFNQAIKAFEMIRNKQGAFHIGEASALQNLHQKIGERKRKRWRKIYASSGAAILLFILISTLFILLYGTSSFKASSYAETRREPVVLVNEGI